MTLTERIRQALGMDLSEEQIQKLSSIEQPPGGGSASTEDILRQIAKGGNSDRAVDILRDLVQQRDKEIAQLRTELSEGQRKIDAYEQEKAERQRILEDEKKQQKQQQIDQLIQTAKDEGRIPADNADAEQRYRAILTADFDNGQQLLADLPKRTPDHKTKEGGKEKVGARPSAEQTTEAIDQAALDAFAST